MKRGEYLQERLECRHFNGSERPIAAGAHVDGVVGKFEALVYPVVRFGEPSEQAVLRMCKHIVLASLVRVI